MFAMKSMDRNSSLLKLKLDLVYRDLAIDEAKKRFDELNVPHPEVAVASEPEPVVVAPKRKQIRALIPGQPSARSAAAKAAYAALSDEAKVARLNAMREGRAKKAAEAPKAVLPAAK